MNSFCIDIAPSARTTPAGWKGSSRSWRPFNQHRNTNFAGNNQFHQPSFNQFTEHFNQKLRNLENTISKMNEESEKNFTKRMVEIESNIFNQYQQSVDFNTKMLEEKLTDVVFKTMDHDSFMNMVDKKFDHLNDVFTKCIDSKPRKVFKDTGENTIEHFIYDSDGFGQYTGNSKHELEYDFKDMSDFNKERFKNDIKNPNVFNQEIGENDIKQEVCLMGSTDSVR